MTRKVKASTVVVLFLLAISLEAKGTVLYVRISSNEIVMGTDSKRTAETGETVCVCKITQIGNTFVASAGLAEFGAFDPKEFAREAINDSQTLLETRTRFEQLISQPLIDVLQRVKKKHPARYEVFKRGAVINMVFARFSDQPELVASALTPTDAPDGSIVLVKHPVTVVGRITRAKRIFVGVSKRVEVLLDRPSFWSKGVIPTVQRVLEMSIEDNSEAGYPIDVVQITKSGARWFPHEPRCDDKSRRMGDQPPTCNSSGKN